MTKHHWGQFLIALGVGLLVVPLGAALLTSLTWEMLAILAWVSLVMALIVAGEKLL